MASYSYARRVALASEKLAAAGIQRQRGVDAYRQWKALAPTVREAATVAKVRRDPNYRPGGTQARITAAVRGARRRAAPLRSVSTAAGDIAYTGNRTVLVSLLRQAQARGHLVAFRATYVTDAGEPRTRIVDGTAAQLAALDTALGLGRGALTWGTTGAQRPLPLDAHLTANRGGRLRAGVELRSGSHPGKYARGMDPADVLALIRAAGGDVWLALYLLWAVGYE